MAIEIVDFPMNNGVYLHSQMLVHQRVREHLQESSYLMGNSMVSGFDFPWNQSIETRNRKLEVFKKFVVPTCHS